MLAAVGSGRNTHPYTQGESLQRKSGRGVDSVSPALSPANGTTGAGNLFSRFVSRLAVLGVLRVLAISELMAKFLKFGRAQRSRGLSDSVDLVLLM